jgi:hypothetical protein
MMCKNCETEMNDYPGQSEDASYWCPFCGTLFVQTMLTMDRRIIGEWYIPGETYTGDSND